MTFERTRCSCPGCVRCCYRHPGPLAVGDYERIAAVVGEDVAREKLRRSYGALLASSYGIVRVPTITPAMRDDGGCVFLTEEDRCSIHESAPAGCALFDVHMGERESQRRSLWLHRGIMQSESYASRRETLRPHDLKRR